MMHFVQVYLANNKQSITKMQIYKKFPQMLKHLNLNILQFKSIKRVLIVKLNLILSFLIILRSNIQTLLCFYSKILRLRCFNI